MAISMRAYRINKLIRAKYEALTEQEKYCLGYEATRTLHKSAFELFKARMMMDGLTKLLDEAKNEYI